MSSDNAKLHLIEDQNAGEVLREMGYEPEHTDGTPSEQAKALLEEAAGNLNDAYDRMEEGTDSHDTVGSACDDLAYVMYQTGAWQGDEGKQWLDGSDPVEHAVDCLTCCEEVAICGDQGATSTELVREAADSLNRAAILLWGDRFTAELESRHEENQRRAATILKEMREAEDERAKAILDVIAKADMDEAKSRARADAPTTLEEALDLLASAADWANWLHSATDYMGKDTEDERETVRMAKDVAMNVMTETMAAYYYLNGGTFADRDPEDTAERIRELAKDIHDNELTIFDMNDMESMGEANMADARAKARSYEARDETEAAEFAANVADGINRVAVTCAYASCTPGIDEGMRDMLESLAKKTKTMLVEIVSVCDHLNGRKTAENVTTDGESLEGIPYIEIGYADGSTLRTIGHFGPHTVADVARLITLETAPTEEEEM